jgi:alanyl-tRNA synthetase
MGRVEAGNISVGEAIDLAVEGDRRTRLRANHSVTHLLHRALRDQLGAHVTQKGSLVAADHLRFDFSHQKAMSGAEITAVEARVNAMIRANDEVTTRLMTPDEAVEAGALALFGEKYGDEVRVVSMGLEGGEKRYSVELCGGTHVRRTGDIGLFCLTAEAAVASGVRRIEALTGAAALEYFLAKAALLKGISGQIKAPDQDAPARIEALLKERKALERELKDARKQLALGGGAATAGPEAVKVGDVPYLADTLKGVSAGDLRSIADEAKKKLGSGVVAFVAVNEGKAALLVGVTDDLTDRISAVDLVRAGAEALGGKGGGGRPDMAQAGGPDGAAAEKALKAIEERIAAG